MKKGQSKNFKWMKGWKDNSDNKCSNRGPACAGGFWIAGWLFTIGFAQLSFWRAVLAIFIWAYYLGEAVVRAVG